MTFWGLFWGHLKYFPKKIFKKSKYQFLFINFSFLAFIPNRNQKLEKLLQLGNSPQCPSFRKLLRSWFKGTPFPYKQFTRSQEDLELKTCEKDSSTYLPHKTLA